MGMGLLDGQLAVVTGGASGIGRATARRMAEEGSRVAVIDINGEAARRCAEEIGGTAHQADVTDPDGLRAAPSTKRRRHSAASPPCSTTPASGTRRRSTTGTRRNGTGCSE